LKTKLQAEGSELSQNMGQLKMEAEDGKFRETDVADTEQAKGVMENAQAGKKGGAVAKMQEKN